MFENFPRYNRAGLEIKDKILIFKLTCEVTVNKMNFRGHYDNSKCDICENEDDSREHILECEN